MTDHLHQGGVILIVDDEPLNRKLLRGHLERWGYEVISAASGAEALEAVSSLPDLILLDIMMPGLDGFATCSRLKEQEAYSDIPVIFLSALDDAENKARGLEVGGVDYVGKPFFSRELQARVSTHLTLRRQEQILRTYNDTLESMVEERSRKLIAAERELQRDYDIQTVLNEILRQSLGNDSLQEHMERALDLILSLSWFPTLGRGSMFIAGDNGELKMVAHKGLPPEDVARCSRLSLGECVCGASAKSRSVMVSRSDDPVEGRLGSYMEPHTTLCVPILKGDTILGLFGLYMEYGYTLDRKEEEFTSSLSTTLAQIISYCQAMDKLVLSEETYRTVFENTGTAMAILRPDMSMELANSTFKHLFLPDGESGFPNSMLQIVHPDERERFTLVHDSLAPGDALSEAPSPPLPPAARSNHEFRFLHAGGHTLDTVLAMSRLPGSRSSVVSLVDVSDRKNAERQLIYHAFHDTLTGLPNRTMFLDHVNKRISLGLQPSESFAMMLLDLDRFSIINESLGHALGDKLLVALSRRLASFVGEDDLVARLGGDEFAIFLDRTDENRAKRMATDILETIREPFALESNTLFSTASAGITTSGGGYERAEDMLRDTDAALHRAKLSGKARFEVFDLEMHVKARQVMAMVNDMRFALERSEFLLHYQPLVRLDTAQPIGVEALVRWNHPERGFIPPSDFIPLAEETGIINQLGSWVLAESCSAIAGLKADTNGAPPLSVSVNVSVRQFDQEDIFERIERIILDSGLSSNRLKLEITESAIMQDVHKAVDILTRLKSLDVSILVDDFGTGYSSLSYLHRFPLDMLKIDRSFVSRMHEGGEHIETVRTIINLARNLGLDIIAEGVETEEQREQLITLGCEFAQGYLFSKPLSLDELLALGLDRGAAVLA